MVAAAVIGSAVVGGVVSSRASGKAADAQKDAAKSANNTQLYMYEQTREDQAPFREAGSQAIDTLANQLGLFSGLSQVEDPVAMRERIKAQYRNKGLSPEQFTAKVNAEVIKQTAAQERRVRAEKREQRASPGFGDLTDEFRFQQDPGYQFRMGEGQRAVEAGAAARGGVLGGRALKELTRYGQGFASNEYNNAFNRFETDRTNRFNRLASLAGVGQTSANTTGALGTQVAGQIGSNQLAAGNAQAAGYVGQANALNNTVSTLGNWYMQHQAMQPAQAQPAPTGTTYSGSPSAATYG